jgi:hypothetical protein
MRFHAVALRSGRESLLASARRPTGGLSSLKLHWNRTIPRIDILETRVKDGLAPPVERLACERHGQVLQAIARLA